MTANGGVSRTQQVLGRIEELVLGELEPGSALPSESTLATELGVSRLTVREAIKSLQARGLVEITQGRRPRAAWPNARPVGDYFHAAVRRDPSQLLDLLEVRHALEVHITSLAAQRATRTALGTLELALAAMREPEQRNEQPHEPPDAQQPAAAEAAESAEDPALAAESAEDPALAALNAADLRFHESLAAASGNQLLAHLMEAMEQPLRASRLQSLRGHLARGGTVADVIAQHERILDRVRARDPAGAAAAMREHLAQTARDLRAAFALADTIDPHQHAGGRTS